jgi:hypothetical protein
MPERIQMTRQRPWRAEHPDAVIVARPSKWGNPHRVGSVIRCSSGGRSWSRPMTPEDAAEFFAVDVRCGLVPFTTEDIRAELAGRDLACWCGVDQPCHGDVLLLLANQEASA